MHVDKSVEGVYMAFGQTIIIGINGKDTHLMAMLTQGTYVALSGNRSTIIVCLVRIYS